MDIITRRLWIIKQILAITDDALLKKIEHLILTDSIHNNEVKEPSEIYLTEKDFTNLPEEIKQEIYKATVKAL